MIQAEFKSRKSGASQCDRILALLKSRAGKWISMPELAAAGNPDGLFCMVHSRISDLRKLGHRIDHQNECSQRIIKSFYKLNL